MKSKQIHTLIGVFYGVQVTLHIDYLAHNVDH